MNSPRDLRRVENLIVPRIKNPDSLAAGRAGKLRRIETQRFGRLPGLFIARRSTGKPAPMTNALKKYIWEELRKPNAWLPPLRSF